MNGTIQIWTWNENTTMSGRLYYGDRTEDNGDVSLWGEGTPEALVAQALDELATRTDLRPGGAGDSFRWRKARNVLKYLDGPAVEYDEQRRAYCPATG